MKVTVEAHINIPADLKKVRDPKFWEFGANEWWKFLFPYIPMETGTTAENVKIRGKSGNGEIEFLQPGAHYVYRGELMIDPETGSSYARAGAKKVYTGKELNISTAVHPLASKEFDKAAEPTQKPKLIKAMQEYIDSGRLKLSE